MKIGFSHYSPLEINDLFLEWKVTSSGFAISGVQVPAVECSAFAVTELGFVSFEIPRVDQPTTAMLELKLFNGENLIASTEQEIFIFPEILPSGGGLSVFSTELRAPLEKLGYSVTDDLSHIKVAVVRVLDDTLREFVLRGGRVLLLAEDEDALQMHIPGLKIKERADTAWQGDWASTFGWHRFDRLPTSGVVNFAFAGLTPGHIISGFSSRDFAFDVYAGLFVGWLHKPVPTVARRRMGNGEVVVSTFRLARNLNKNPLAMYVFAELMMLMKATEQNRVEAPTLI